MTDPRARTIIHSSLIDKGGLSEYRCDKCGNSLRELSVWNVQKSLRSLVLACTSGQCQGVVKYEWSEIQKFYMPYRSKTLTKSVLTKGIEDVFKGR